MIGGAIGLAVEALHPLIIRVPRGEFIDVNVVSLFSPLISGSLLVLLGAFVARLPDLDLQLGLPHRGITHSIAAAAIVTALVGALASVLVPAAAFELMAVTGATYLSHLAADGFNPVPEAVLWPLPRYRARWLPSVREESLAGKAVEAAIWVLVLGAIGWRVTLAGA